MSWFQWILLVPVISLAACSYGPEHTFLDLQTFVAKPGTHQFAVSLDYRRVRDPTGFINTFPNGGVQQILTREARIYLGDLDRGTVELVAAIPSFAGVPQPKAVRIEGWSDDALYFSLFGYGGSARDGDDLSDERRLFYRVTAKGSVEQVGTLPTHFEREGNINKVPSAPFLRWKQRGLDVDIAIDTRIPDALAVVTLTFDQDTAEPRLRLP